jgi:hypothetical protein
MRTRFLALSAGFIILLVSTCAAQQVNGYSDIYYDDSTGRVIARCETYLDYDVAAYYQASVQCSILDGNGHEVAWAGASDYSFWGLVDADTSAAAEPDMLYEVWGYHDGQTFVHAAGLYPDQWTDYYNFLSLDPNIWPDWNNPQYFSFMGPGPPMGTGDPYIQLATSYDEVVTPCDAVRQQIIQEYVDYGVAVIPPCRSFTQTAHSQYFTFSELNTSDYAWALIRSPLTVNQSSGYGLDRWRVEYGGPRTINSAYRNPARNARVGGVPNSRHVYGDAGDLRNESYGGPNEALEWQAMYDAATRAHADWKEATNGPCGLRCFHADWRNH